MNELIEQIFAGFKVDGKEIPVCFLHYDGHDEPYVIYQHTDSANSLSGDDDYLGWVEYYDFDIYSKGNYFKVAESLIKLLRINGFVFVPSRCSADMYETETEYYHKTLTFAYLKQTKEVN